MKYRVKCDVAENGKIGYEKFIANREKVCCSTYYKLVLTDLDMPVMDGIKSAKLMIAYQKTLKESDRAPIVVITAFDTSYARPRCRKSGISALLNKPIQIEKLYQIMDKLNLEEVNKKSA